MPGVHHSPTDMGDMGSKTGHGGMEADLLS